MNTECNNCYDCDVGTPQNSTNQTIHFVLRNTCKGRRVIRSEYKLRGLLASDCFLHYNLANHGFSCSVHKPLSPHNFSGHGYSWRVRRLRLYYIIILGNWITTIPIQPETSYLSNRSWTWDGLWRQTRFHSSCRRSLKTPRGSICYGPNWQSKVGESPSPNGRG